MSSKVNVIFEPVPRPIEAVELSHEHSVDDHTVLRVDHTGCLGFDVVMSNTYSKMYFRIPNVSRWLGVM